MQTRTIAGSVSVRFYQISFTIYNLGSPGPDLFRPTWMVTNMIENPDDVDVLFGLDLLRSYSQRTVPHSSLRSIFDPPSLNLGTRRPSTSMVALPKHPTQRNER